MVKLNDRKALKAKGAIYNALVLKGMNDLIVKHYVMGFQKMIRQQMQYKEIDILKGAQMIENETKKVWKATISKLYKTKHLCPPQ